VGGGQASDAPAHDHDPPRRQGLSSLRARRVAGRSGGLASVERLPHEVGQHGDEGWVIPNRSRPAQFQAMVGRDRPSLHVEVVEHLDMVADKPDGHHHGLRHALPGEPSDHVAYQSRATVSSWRTYGDAAAIATGTLCAVKTSGVDARAAGGTAAKASSTRSATASTKPARSNQGGA